MISVEGRHHCKLVGVKGNIVTEFTIENVIPDAGMDCIANLIGGLGGSAIADIAFGDGAITGTVLTGSSNGLSLVDSSRNEANNYWKGAELEFTGTGFNSGIRRQVKTWTKGTHKFTFESKFPNTIQAGDVYVLTPHLGATALNNELDGKKNVTPVLYQSADYLDDEYVVLRITYDTILASTGMYNEVGIFTSGVIMLSGDSFKNLTWVDGERLTWIWELSIRRAY